MNTIITWFTNRLVEPSTWLGIGNVIGSVFHKDWGSAIQAGAGVLGIVIPEAKK
jgi:hypothetical protein